MDAKTAVNTIFVDRDRAYNRRFQQMYRRYLVDPLSIGLEPSPVVARTSGAITGNRLNERPCTPASGWEKGQVENQVGVVRRRFAVLEARLWRDVPRPKFKSYAELNDATLFAIGSRTMVGCSRIAVFPGPRPTRTRGFGIERSGRCSRTSARVLSPTSVRSIIARQAICAANLPGGGFHAVPASVSKSGAPPVQG